jgi:hypothetical protein
MQHGWTYCSQTWERLDVYTPEGFAPPDEITLIDPEGEDMVLFRLDDRALTCGKVLGVTGSCDSYECHRTVLGMCQCGRHKDSIDAPHRRGEVRMEKA